MDVRERSEFPEYQTYQSCWRVFPAGESLSFSRPRLDGATLSMDEMVAVRWLLQRAGVVEGHEGAHTSPQDGSGEDPGANNPVVMDDKHVLVRVCVKPVQRVEPPCASPLQAPSGIWT